MAGISRSRVLGLIATASLAARAGNAAGLERRVVRLRRELSGVRLRRSAVRSHIDLLGRPPPPRSDGSPWSGTKRAPRREARHDGLDEVGRRLVGRTLSWPHGRGLRTGAVWMRDHGGRGDAVQIELADGPAPLFDRAGNDAGG